MNFFQKTASRIFSASDADKVLKHQYCVHAQTLGRDVIFDVYLPPDYDRNEHQRFPLMLFNDGQDLPRMNLEAILEKGWAAKTFPPAVVAGAYASERRIREYGTARQADYKGRGDLAPQYTRFVLEEWLPYLKQHFRLMEGAPHTAFAGFSLGALSALDIAWAHPEIFGAAGIFSGSLWWRSHEVREEDPDADRIMHDIVEKSGKIDPDQRFWFQCGTLDETDDRNHNGVIDAIDDTLDLLRAMRAKGISEARLRYLEIQDGRHEPSTWGEAMPDFLKWALKGS